MRKIAGILLAFLLLPLSLCLFSSCKKRAGQSCVIEAEYFPKDRQLKGRMQVNVVNAGENALEEIAFALPAAAYRADAKTPPMSEAYRAMAYYAGESYGDIVIESASGKGWRVGGEDSGTLFVSPEKPLYPNESATVEICFCTTLAKANARLGEGERTVNFSGFYPQLLSQHKGGFYEYAPASVGDMNVFDVADYTLNITVPAGVALVSGGEVSSQTQNAKTIYTIAQARAREAAFVLGSFSCASQTLNGVQIDYFYFEDEAPQATLQTAARAVAAYSNLFGDYPFGRYAIAEASLVQGGMEESGLSMISSALRGQSRAEAVAHETAHQWWHALVGSNETQAAWQDEGLAEYSVALFYEGYPEYGDYRAKIESCERTYRAYYSVKSQLGEADTSMTRPLTSFSGDYEYRVLSYDKGAVLFDRVRSALGDKSFFAALKKYAEEYGGKLALQEQLISCFSPCEELMLSFIEGRCVI